MLLPPKFSQNFSHFMQFGKKYVPDSCTYFLNADQFEILHFFVPYYSDTNNS